jgi:putative ABC transport system ATP-binding protein
LQARGLTRTYRDGLSEIPALRGIDLDIGERSLTVVTGPSGSGKSTLLHVLSGLDRPDEGRVVLAGIDLGNLPERELALVRRRQIGFVLQYFNLLPTLSVLENVAFPLLLDNERDSLARARRSLADVGLEPDLFAARRPEELSGGQQQRVALARALVAGPAAVFADEPTGNLDSATGAEILALLRRVADGGQAILLVTHDERALPLADRVVRLLDGRIVAEGAGSS